MTGCCEAYKRKFAGMSIRPQLLLSYGVSVCSIFSLVLCICAVSIYTLRDQVLNKSEEYLRLQVTKNCEYVLSEAAEVFTERMTNGLRVFALTASYAIHDKSVQSTRYSISPPSRTYHDTQATDLKQPTTYDDRFVCKGTDSEAHKGKRGCQLVNANLLKAISAEASSVYITGFKYDGSNVPQMLSTYAESVDLSSVIDPFMRQNFLAGSGWLGSYVALKKNDIGIVRVFPGFVGNLSVDSQSSRTYNPVVRPWFTNSFQLENPKMEFSDAGQGSFSTTFTEPYLSWDGNGFMMTVATNIQGRLGENIGVATSDVQVLVMKDIVAKIKLRESGSAHLYHILTKKVAASGQWSPTIGSSDHLMASEILLQPGKEAAGKLPVPPTCAGTEETDGELIMRRSVLEQKYCLAAVVPVSEVLAPIDQQREEIEGTSDGLFITSLIVLLCCMFGLVLPCVFVISMQLSEPLIRTSRDSDKIVNNIGGNLFEGVTVDTSTAGGIGEVQQMREIFLKMLYKIKTKREAILLPDANFMRNKMAVPEGRFSKTLQSIQLPQSNNDANPDGETQAEFPAGKTGRSSFISDEPLTCCNKIKVRLALQLTTPMALALLCIILVTSILMFQKIDEWIGPVKDTMIKEELQMLDIRAYERAQLVSEIFNGYSKTVLMMKDYTENVFNGNLNFGTAYYSNFAPFNLCKSHFGASSMCQFSDLPVVEDTKRLTKKDGSPARRVNFDMSVWYAPTSNGLPMAPARLLYEPAGTSPSQVAFSGTILDEHGDRGRATHLDNVLRVAYFSSNANFVYFGFEKYEVYRQYPWMNLGTQFGDVSPTSAFQKGIDDCDGEKTTKFTPLCRKWYIGAKQKQEKGTVFFGEVDVDSVTDTLYLPLSVAMYDNTNKFIGVAAVDVNLQNMESTLIRTPLYKDGVAYLFDSQGYALIHKNLDTADIGSGKKRASKLAGGDDQNFINKYEECVVSKFGQTGTCVIPWENPETGSKEDWHYSFLLVPGTPYQLILSVVDRDVKAKAIELEDDLRAVAITQLVVTLIIDILAALLLLYISSRFDLHFVRPIQNFVQLLLDSERSSYASRVDPDAGAWSSELQKTQLNFEKMVWALRFGNQDYLKGDKIKELEVLRNVLGLVEGTGNQRGQGVCMSNFANCVRAMDDKTQAHAQLSQEELDVVQMMRKAVENARALSVEVDSGVSKDTIGQRLLGLALAQCHRGNEADATTSMEEAIRIHQETGSWQSLARLSYAVVMMDGGNVPDALKASITNATDIALHMLSETHTIIRPHDGNSVAQLCIALTLLHNDSTFAIWGLNSLPRVDTPLVVRMATVAKMDEEQVSKIDALMKGRQGIRWRNGPVKALGGGGPPQPKAMQFVLDASGSMSGRYLDICKKSIHDIIDNNTEENDMVGFIAFAHFTKDIFPMMLKRDNVATMHDLVSKVDTFGRTAFYDAVLDGMKRVETLDSAIPKWVIALTDGGDTDSKTDKVSGSIGAQACLKLQDIENVNIAVITVGNLPQETIEVVSKYVSTAENAGNKGFHVVAEEASKIAEAFEAIGKMMADDGGLAEHL